MAQGTTDLSSLINDTAPWSARAVVEVYIPQSADPIRYTLDMRQAPSAGDSLLPCSYLIGWQLPRPADTTSGWTSYFHGNLYQCRAQRLKEYHYAQDPVAFEPRRVGIMRGEGVHRAAQFGNLLPTLLRERLATAGTDSAYSVQQPRPGLVRLWRRHDGEVIEETELACSPEGRPLKYEVITSPGTISEQTMTVTYEYDCAPAASVPATEPELIAMYPDDFAQWRQSNFTIDRMPGQPMVQFTAPTPTGERYTHHRGEAFRAPTIVAVLDPGTGSTPDVVKALRRAQKALPQDSDLILAFTGNNIEEIDAIAGPCGLQERILLGARGLARDLGASALPVVVLCDTDGRVADVVTAYNNDLADIVMQKAAMLK